MAAGKENFRRANARAYSSHVFHSTYCKFCQVRNARLWATVMLVLVDFQPAPTNEIVTLAELDLNLACVGHSLGRAPRCDAKACANW
jgi:hypothetical protein